MPFSCGMGAGKAKPQQKERCIMLIVKPKYETIEKEIEGKKVTLSFYLNNLDKINVSRKHAESNIENNMADFQLACFDTCEKALKKIEGLDTELDLSDEETRIGILSCSELISIEEIIEMSMRVRGLGEAVRAMKQGLKDSADNSLLLALEKKSAENVQEQSQEPGSDAEKVDSVK